MSRELAVTFSALVISSLTRRRKVFAQWSQSRVIPLKQFVYLRYSATFEEGTQSENQYKLCRNKITPRFEVCMYLPM